VRYLYDETLNEEQLAAHLARRFWTGPPHDDHWANLAVCRRDSGTFLGEVGLALHDEVHRRAEVGYVFTPHAAGSGYATEATAAMVEIAFTVLGAHRVEARMDARNARSARVAERLGMRKEAHLRENEWVKGEWTDEVVYGLLAPEWHPRDEWELRRVR
jgi:RimJ/RimL family protein N-acetyltransferase